MKKRHSDCKRADGFCALCELSSGRTDCHGLNIPNLLYCRQLKGWTLRQLSSDTGIKIAAIQQWESGRRSIGNASAVMVAKIAKALSISVEELIRD